ncbi:MAG: adenylate/guanylate cyclase domain-containing protein [Desulfobulbaceae bacterium]|nr:adenylate/guanylate cyclase domain-containing protein [Desulfobulbaceae bacterium]
MKNPEKLKRGNESRQMSIFFSHLEGFTSISESLGQAELTHLLNDYLAEMTDIILEEQGTVDKVEGDAIIAFWNAPLEVENHAEGSVRAAMRCQHRLTLIRPDYLEEYGKVLNMRIGINSGTAILGNMGSTRFDYTVPDDAVNLAARLGEANKVFGTHTILSESTFKQLGKKIFCRELARIRVVGRKEEVRIYEPLSDTGTGTEKEYRSFLRGLELFYAGNFKPAWEEFMKTAAKDGAARAYSLKCRDLDDSPPERWDGVWELAGK